MRFMIFAVVTILLSACSGKYIAPKSYQFERTAIVDRPKDEVWSKLHVFLSQQRYVLKNVRKDEGLILAQGKDKSFDGLDCGSVKGRAVMYDTEYEFSVSVASIGPNQSSVTVNLDGKSIARRYRKFLFIPLGHSSAEVACESTGNLEGQILAVARI